MNLFSFLFYSAELPDAVANLTSLENLNLFNNDLEVRMFSLVSREHNFFLSFYVYIYTN